ncbi:TRAP transporter large permease subunit [Streptococcus orisasini]
MMYTGVFALLVYIAVILVWALVIKRNMAEGMLLGLIAVSLFSGSQILNFLIDGLVSALFNEVLYASLAFIIMSFLMIESGLIQKILAIFNALLGKIKGGPAFLNITISALFGMLSGSNSANTATSGTFTSQWMIETGWKPEIVSTLVAGNGGLGAGFPPSASMFIMLGFAKVSGLVDEGELYLGLFVSGLYQVIYRIFLVSYLMRKQDIKVILPHSQLSTFQIIKKNWTALLIFLGAIIPILLTIGPLSQFLSNYGMAEALESISLLTWIPTLMIALCLILGWQQLKDKVLNINYCAEHLFPQFKTIGGVLLFAFAASEVLANLGLEKGLTQIFTMLNLPKALMVLLIAILVVLVAGPLSSTATLTSIGLIAFTGLTSAGVPPLLAVVSILVFASTEGASPPASGSIFIASSLAQVEPEKTFYPLIIYFVIPILIIGWLIAMGILPLFV